MAPESQGTRCTGCKQLFPNPRGYGNHKRSCKLQKAAAAARLDERRQNLKRREEDARRVRVQEDLNDEDIVMMAEDISEMHIVEV
jgi:hypothetical protein